MNLSGLSAVYPGYSAQENATATTEQNQAAAQEAAIKLLGAHVLGRAFTGGQPSQSPQPPAPGQPSVPNQPPPPTQPPPVQGAPAALPPPAAPQAPPMAQGQPGAPPSAGGSGLPEMTLQSLTQRILATSPQVRNHPEVMMAALERAAPILDRQSKEDLADLRKTMQEARLKQTGELVQARIDAAKAYHDQTSADKNAAEAGRQGRFDIAEARRQASNDVRQDQGYQRLELQKQDLERKIQQGGDKQALGQWRAIVDAQHKRATEIIQSGSVTSGLKAPERKALLDGQRADYESEIAAMRGRMGSTTPTGGTAPVGAPAAPKIEGQIPQGQPGLTAQPPAQAPPVAMLKPGGINIINGVGWRLVNGQPVQAPIPGQ